jgi:hypothetical protein
MPELIERYQELQVLELEIRAQDTVDIRHGIELHVKTIIKTVGNFIGL